MRKKLLFLSVIVSIVLITVHLFSACVFRFDNIVLAEGNYLADDDGTKIRIFQMSEKKTNRAESSIEYGKIFEDSNGGLGYNYPIDIAGNNGKIYLLNVKSFFSERPSEYEIRLLDFKRKKSPVIFSFPETELEAKLRNYLENEDSSFFVCGDKFEIDDDGIILYLAEYPLDYRGKNPVYRCKLIGGEIGSAEMISEYQTDNYDSIMTLGDRILQLDSGYHPMIGGEPCGFLENERFSGFIQPDSANDNVVIGKSLGSGGFYRFYQIDLENETAVEIPELYKFVENKTLNFSDVVDLNVTENNNFAVCFDGEKSFLFDPELEKKSDKIFTESVLEAVLHSLVIMIVSVISVWLIGFLIGILRTKGKVSEKFIALMIPVMIGCDLAVFGLINFGMSTIENYSLQNSLQTISAQYDSLDLTNNIGDFDIEGEYRNDVSRFIRILMDSEYLKYAYWTEDRGTSANVNFLGYVQSGNFFAAASDIIEGNLDVDIIAEQPAKTAEKIRLAIEEKSDKYCRIYDGGLERVFLISPTYFAGDNSVNGVFLYSVSAAEVRYNTGKLLKRLMFCKLILSAIISLLFTLSAVFPLRDLKKLQKKSAEYLSGGFVPRLSDEKDRGSGCINEIDVISKKFDELLRSVYGDLNEIDNLRKANAAYFSDVILKIFNKKTINSIKLGESASVNVYCIKALLPEKKYSDFDKMHKLLSTLGKRLKENNAFAANIDDTEISVYSPDPASLNILFFFREYDSEIIAAADRCYIDINIVNAGGSYRFNIVPEDKERGEILMDTLKNTNSSTAVTESALGTRKDELSVICIGMTDNEFICEISDGVKERFANSIKDDLKNGVEKYFNGDKTRAREMFVKILKLQQNNSIARYYIDVLDETERG